MWCSQAKRDLGHSFLYRAWDSLGLWKNIKKMSLHLKKYFDLIKIQIAFIGPHLKCLNLTAVVIRIIGNVKDVN